MSNQSAYLSAALPEPFRILGFDLEPFTVGHYLVLARAGNPFVIGERAPALLDLFQALFVCSRSSGEAQCGLNRKPFKRFFRQVRRRLRLRTILVRCWLLPISSVSVSALIDSFVDYLSAHSQGPDVSQNNDSDQSVGTPFIQFVIVSLMAFLNHTPDAAMNRIWSHALHDVFAYWELVGKAKLVSDQDRELLEEHQRLLKEFDAKLTELERGNDGLR